MITLNNKLFLSLGVFWFYYFLRKNNALVQEMKGVEAGNRVGMAIGQLSGISDPAQLYCRV